MQRALALDLEADLEERLATRVERVAAGAAIFRDDLPRAGNLNVLRVDPESEAREPAELMQVVEELQAGLPQRSIRVVDDAEAERLRPAFAGAGWVVQRASLMAGLRPPDRPVDVSSVREVELELLHDAREATLRRAHRDLDSATALLAAGGLSPDGVETRAFAALVGADVAAYAVARVVGSAAKLTEVAAMERSHGHGLGRAVVWAAAAALRRTGTRLVTMEAEDDDWARSTYQRLGFGEIGRIHRLVRPWGD
ncbi:MAG TPA: GNAT family N-acetyltransferase [Thermoleophilaceae bacterium]|jgi:ribosomal protein S18 acetylase RimI-like enzyme